MSLIDANPSQRRRGVMVAALLVSCLAALSAHADTPQTIGIGTMEYAELIDGPAVVTMRTLTIAPGEVLGWHQRPGAGVHTIEDGCGGGKTYSQGQAFHEPAGRVHRGKNPTITNVATAQAFLVRPGTPTSHPHAERECGIPKS